MKKRLLQSILFMFLTLWAWAEPVDVETARQKAANFFNQQPSAHGRRKVATAQQMQLLYAKRETQEEAPLLYVFGVKDSEGYVVIAGDNNAIAAVLGYSKTGTFDADNMPDNLRYWLEEYCKQLEYARKSPSTVKRVQTSTPKESITPLIASKWGQNSPYNNLCPIDPNTGLRSDAGCVATAIAQIMYYHKWPEQGVDSHSYEWEGQTLSANFGATTYQWDKMKDTYDGADDDPNDAVATLTYHIGVAADAWYSSNGTAVTINSSNRGHYKSTIENIFTTYFNYSESVSASTIDYSWYSEHNDIIYNELLANRPVLIGGGTHIFVCDGYENEYYHFNFGWNGAYDDYFLLTAINPGGNDYNFSQMITYGIRKPGDKQTIDGIQYELFEDGTARIVEGSGEGECIIPSSLQVDGKNYEVTVIGNEAFAESGITSITIPNSITSIGSRAFYNCSSIASVTIPGSIITIRDHAFEECSGLISVNIQNGVKYIGGEAFLNCGNLTSVSIPNSVIEIGYGAFSGCNELTTPIYTSTTFIRMPQSYEGEYTIPDGITKIASTAFARCNKITTLTIPNSVTEIEWEAFDHCSASMTIPASVKKIAQYAFANCSGLTSLTVSKNLTSIGECTFIGCNNLISIVVEEGHSIYDSRNNCNAIIETATNTLLYGCNYTVIPDDITKIGYGAFRGYSDFTTINIPNSVKTIGYDAFCGCSSLTSVEIPEGVTTIYDGAFQDCTNLVSASLPGSLQEVGNNMFQGCSKLENVTLTEGISYISYEMFRDCTNLYSIMIPNSVTEIWRRAFSGCGLTSVIIPNGVTTIMEGAFGDCKELTSFSIPSSVNNIANGALSGSIGITSILVDEGNSVYDSRDNCNAIIETASNTLIIGCKNTTIPQSVTSIGESAFSGCTGLSTMNIPDGVTSIGESAFYGCTSLSTLNMSDNVTSIGQYAFLGCSSLTSITLPSNVSIINGWTFYECSNLITVSLPQNLMSIGRCVFYGCTKITDMYCFAVDLPETDVFSFDNMNANNVTLHVPAASIEAYRTSSPWSGFGRIVSIDDFEINDETTSFSINAEGNGKNVIFTHYFTGNWESLYLPFAIDYDAIRDDFDLAEIDGVVQNDDNYDGIADITVLSIMGFREQMTVPNTPYLIRAKSPGEQTINFDNVTIYPTEEVTFECSSFSTRYEFTGSYNTLGASALENRYVVQGGELVKGANSLAPFRWHMTATARKGSLNLPNKIRIMLVEDVITGVSSLGETEEESVTYNLAGQRLSKMQKGINIVGGRKVLIK